jgi:hypothetical protein
MEQTLGVTDRFLNLGKSSEKNPPEQHASPGKTLPALARHAPTDANWNQYLQLQ